MQRMLEPVWVWSRDARRYGPTNPVVPITAMVFCITDEASILVLCAGLSLADLKFCCILPWFARYSCCVVVEDSVRMFSAAAGSVAVAVTILARNKQWRALND
jgi:hypothetical protein